ncbi:MAG: polysaccharide deacetylase family protein [Pigmentiphaga sp.]
MITSSSPKPEDIRLTIVLTFLMENWSPGKAPPYSPMTSPPKAGAIDRAGVKWSDYGGKSGMARLAHIARTHGVSGTACINARSAELFPDTVKHLVNAGFEVAGHNYAQDEVLSGMERDDEAQLIQRCLGILEDISGTRPTGWLSSTIACTDNTAELLAQENLLWHGDYNDIDLPIQLATPAGNIVAIPHSDYADNRALRGAPDWWFNCYQHLFDYQYRKEPGSFINITMHGNFGGRPLMAAQLDRLLSYIGQHDGVWMPRHDELAHWINQHGAQHQEYFERYPLKPA